MILEKINSQIADAMKNGDKKTLSTLRMAKDAILKEKINLNHELSEDEVINTLKKFVKQKKDSIEEYKKYNKQEVIEDLEREVSLIKEYLPEELNEDDINKGLDEIFDRIKPESIKDMGRLMKEANEVFGVRADKALVSKLIKERLS